ncbi:hypothetical protein MES5069_160051 [Mesorhizobium escarrei]|uniref:Uncharacterized protein n=1 Tax=Mesorhizobium escarrei TaxID=666018 RepID=A0ABM9DMA0_9HYPH|nr:hypothetical protein MES5069_160051 [Mesorhizobium escarrei]
MPVHKIAIPSNFISASVPGSELYPTLSSCGRIFSPANDVNTGFQCRRGKCDLSFDRRGRLEGMVSKRGDSKYRSGPTTSWLKTKSFTESEFELLGVERERGKPAFALMARSRHPEICRQCLRQRQSRDAGDGFGNVCRNTLARRRRT